MSEAVTMVPFLITKSILFTLEGHRYAIFHKAFANNGGCRENITLGTTCPLERGGGFVICSFGGLMV